VGGKKQTQLKKFSGKEYSSSFEGTANMPVSQGNIIESESCQTVFSPGKRTVGLCEALTALFTRSLSGG
jgi:hypothetical protein